MARRLIVNADDFGFTTDVNAGVIEAHQRGILTATTLMANGSAFEHAVALAQKNPSLDVGCHLVLVGGKSVADPGIGLPGTVRQLMTKLLTGSAWIERELAAQVEKILRAGLKASHLDTHKHTHLAPPVLDALCRVSERFGIPWIRRPFDLPLTAAGSAATRAINGSMKLMRRRFDRALASHGCRRTDHFAGFQWTGRYGAAELVKLIGRLPEGLTEFMCHPGHCTDELRQARTRLKESRAEELRALTAAEVLDEVKRQGIELTSYRSV